MSKVLILGAHAESLVTLRGELIKSLVAAGHEVAAMSDHTDAATRSRIDALGVSFRSYPVQRSGTNPSRDLTTFLALRSALFALKPDIVVAYMIKPIIWGGLAMRSLGMAARFYAMINGLGLAFQPGGIKQKVLTGLATHLYHWALFRADKVFFQNQDNRQVFVDHQIVDDRRCVVIKGGSGVNLDHYVVTPLPQSKMVFLTAARLLGDKGLREYALAARIIKVQYPNVNFHLVGTTDPSPDGIPLSEVQAWQASGALQYLGATNDVRPFIEQCHIFVLPSYHEGIPKTVLEAMAMGRPIITTGVTGCRETVVDGDNGFLVPAKDAPALAHAMEQFILHPEFVEKMGRRSREIAEERFDVNRVNADIMRAMRLI